MDLILLRCKGRARGRLAVSTVVQVGLEMSRKELDDTIAMPAEAEAVTII